MLTAIAITGPMIALGLMWTIGNMILDREEKRLSNTNHQYWR